MSDSTHRCRWRGGKPQERRPERGGDTSSHRSGPRDRLETLRQLQDPDGTTAWEGARGALAPRTLHAAPRTTQGHGGRCEPLRRGARSRVGRPRRPSRQRRKVKGGAAKATSCYGRGSGRTEPSRAIEMSSTRHEAWGKDSVRSARAGASGSRPLKGTPPAVT